MTDSLTPDQGATVTRLDAGGSGMAAVADAVERLLSVMRRNGMETMHGVVDGKRISVENAP